ncbi:hypothetical protein PHMEG_00029001 [Phytophthora megakarya]|uniref:Uncharacterized protein n=1 Tax=Phytophthora megakarya TaxID=4795 RepID=A0A225V5C2_9STRA|nr:hypothetical protein PHMEG_00029001 [Phytophthora megakarya]
MAYAEGTASIRTAQGTVESLVGDLLAVQPVLCFLLSQVDALVESLTDDALVEKHGLIIDRLLGRNGQRPTRAIQRLLGITPTRQRPAAEDTLQWTSANTGHIATVIVRHAVEYVYYIDGGQCPGRKPW